MNSSSEREKEENQLSEVPILTQPRKKEVTLEVTAEKIDTTLAEISAPVTNTRKPAVRFKGQINGINLEAPPDKFKIAKLKKINDTNANWISVIPYAISYDYKGKVNFDMQRQWWGEKSEGIIETIKMAKKLNLHVMIKPQVWVVRQGWTGDFELDKEEFEIWKVAYRKYILNYAQIANDHGAEMFCIGTEYRKIANKHPEFWQTLIKDIRKVYAGKLTYAANWDNYENIQFWDELDYIGIDAYFPLSDEKTPNIATLKENWQTKLSAIDSIRKKWNKPILFTEYGYQSIDHAASGHWKLKADSLQRNFQAQSNAYEALYQTFWDQEWFAGGFIWKWHIQNWHDHDTYKRFTPQKKPVLEVIKKRYAQ